MRHAAGGMVVALGLAALVVAGMAAWQAPEPAGRDDGRHAMSDPATDRGNAVVQLVDNQAPAVEEAVLLGHAAEHVAAAGPQPEDDDLPVRPSWPVAEQGRPEEGTPPATAKAEASPVTRVGLQAGHWKSAELPDELARFRTSTGTSGGGVAEWELNLDIARRVAELLEAEGIVVDVLPATVPPSYEADAFVALHADGDLTRRLSGFKLARANRSTIPEVDDALLDAIAAEYEAATGLPTDTHVSRNMTGYYAFSRRLKHAIAPTTPAVILEMGFMTNASDLRVLLRAPDRIAEGIARGILRFLDERPQGSGSP